jgi:hypothetical protein
MRPCWVLLIAAVACGDNGSELDEGTRDGTRIKVRWYEFTDGTRQWEPYQGFVYGGLAEVNSEVFYDAELDTTCTPELWLDGVTRCMPRVERSPQKLYTDATCSQRVTERPDLYELVADYDPKCGVERLWHVYPVTRTMPAPSALYYRESSGRCAAAAINATKYGVLGDEMPPERFATMTTTVSEDADRIHVRYRESDDGMRVPIGLHDSLLGPALLDQMYAIPQAGYAGYFAGNTCTERVLRVEPGCAPPVSAYWGQYSKVGERVAVEQTFYGSGPSDCIATPPMPPSDYYRVSDDWVPLADMVTTIDTVPDRRIQLIHSSIGERPVRLHQLFDTELGLECTPYEFPDKVHRCAPSRDAVWLESSLFADAACQTRLDLARVLTSARGRAFLFDDLTAFGGKLSIREVGERYREPIYFLGGQDACEPYIGDLEVFRLGPEVSWDTFASATRTPD